MASASFTEPPSQIAQPYGSVEPASMIGKLAPRPNTSPVPASCATQKPIQVCTSSDSKRLRARWFGVVRKCRASSIPPGIDSSPARSDDGGPGCENSAGIMPSSRTARYVSASSRTVLASRFENRSTLSIVLSRLRDQTSALPFGKTCANWFSGHT